MKKLIFVSAALFAAISCVFESPDPTAWPEIQNVNRPGLRWWWLGSAVDSAGLEYNLEEFASKGFGSVEITPLYGVKGNEANDISYLSPEWMKMLEFCISKGHSLGLNVDMSGCTGWPFGGPWISPENAAKTFAFNADTSAIVMTGTGQMVKRAAPGGEGLVLDHFSRAALDAYLAPFDSAFAASGCPWPDTFFNDSYEVYHAGWTDSLPAAFFADHGYRIEEHVKELALNGATPGSKQVVADYRETVSGLYMREFVRPWGEWCRSHGVPVRHQAHGAPANLIDVYAAADIPEIEAFGQTPFEIEGLHRTGLTRRNDADDAIFKFASSAAHVTGKPLVSCETLTWLTEHFHTTLALCKPEIDLALASGINHVMLHGAPYSPAGAEFPGWKFYATINLSPTNPSIWEVSRTLADYISRCQAFLSQGSPDADFLLYFPIYDIWHHDFPTPLMMLDIHRADVNMAQFKNDVHEILRLGYDVDYISDELLAGVSVARDGRLVTSGGAGYKGLVLPTEVEYMPAATRERIEAIRATGAKVMTISELAACGLPAESARNLPGLHMLRRRLGDGSYAYFVANLGPSTVAEVTLACRAEAVEMLDPMSGRRGFAEAELMPGAALPGSSVSQEVTRVRLDLESGGSVLLKAFPKMPGKHSCGLWEYLGEPALSLDLGNMPWSLDFLRSTPEMPSQHYLLDSLAGWHMLEGGDVTEAVGRYSCSFILPDEGEVCCGGDGGADGSSAGGSSVGCSSVGGSSVGCSSVGGSSVGCSSVGGSSAGCSSVGGGGAAGGSSAGCSSVGGSSACCGGDRGVDGMTVGGSSVGCSSVGGCGAAGGSSAGCGGDGGARSGITACCDGGSSANNGDVTVGGESSSRGFIGGGEWVLSLGDVRENAVVRVNGVEAGTLVAVPFKLRIGEYLHPGANLLEIEVRNLPANRIAQMDRDGEVWRIFKDVNVAPVNGRALAPDQIGTYAWWPVVPSGLLGPVTLTFHPR